MKKFFNGGIYKITNNVNQHFYYGSSGRSFQERWEEHINELDNNSHNNEHLQKAWNKYGKDNFEFSIIHICSPDQCLYWEQILLDMWFDNGKNCYNICPIAGNTLGIKHSKETKKRISIAVSGINNPMYKKIHTPEAKNKISIANKGKHHSIETLDNFSKMRSGEKNSMYGKCHNRNTITKMAEIKSGENNPNAKLNWSKVNEIRLKYKTNNYTQTELCKEYEIKRRQMYQILHNLAWKI